MTLGPVILDLETTTLDPSEHSLLEHPATGGVILFSRNIESYPQLLELIAQIRAVRPELLICVDQEGGRVQRCRDGFTRLPPMQVFDRLHSQNPKQALALAKDCGWLLAAEVLAAGMDFSLAPVLDVDDDFCSVIGDRAFSSYPARVADLAGAFIDGCHEAGMAVTGKHFPGHGSVRGDSHFELPVDERELSDVQARDLQPFQQLMPCLEAIMPAHIVFSRVDKQPVGFSAKWLQQILRADMGYTGVIFSDDLTMEGAAAAAGSYANRAEMALTAGCDFAVVCNNRAGAEEILQQLPVSLYHQNKGARESMRASLTWSMPALQETDRWQRTSAALACLRP